VGFVIHSLSRCKATNSQGYSLIKTSSSSVSYYLQHLHHNSASLLTSFHKIHPKDSQERAKWQKNRDFKGADLPALAVVSDTAGVEMKEERRSCRSSHPYVWPIGGACTKPDSRSADRNGKQKKTDLPKNLKQTACVSLFLLQATVKATTGREEKRGGNRSRSPCLRGFLRWRVEETRRHCSGGIEGLPCNSRLFWG